MLLPLLPLALLLLAGVPARAADCPLPPGANAGQFEGECRSVVSRGVTRTYWAYRPPGLRGDAPVVLVLHGGSGSAAGLQGITNLAFNRAADRHGFVVAYPDGLYRQWNDGRPLEARPFHADDIDDVRFLRDLAGQLSRSGPHYAAGLSNGGMMSLRLACEASDRFGAVAAVAASLPAPLAAACQPRPGTAVMLAHGTADGLVPFGGGPITILGRTYGQVLGVEATMALLGQRLGCAPLAAAQRFPADGVPVFAADAGCAQGGRLRLHRIEGGGHTWPGGRQYLPVLLIGPTAAYDGAEAIWRFFQGAPG